MTVWSRFQRQVESRAAACHSCNLYKSNRLEVSSLETGGAVSLFNPRSDAWSEHFRWTGYQLTGLTAVGRATIAALRLNHPRRIKIRQAEELFGLFPPAESS